MIHTAILIDYSIATLKNFNCISIISHKDFDNYFLIWEILNFISRIIQDFDYSTIVEISATVYHYISI